MRFQEEDENGKKVYGRRTMDDGQKQQRTVIAYLSLRLRWAKDIKFKLPDSDIHIKSHKQHCGPNHRSYIQNGHGYGYKVTSEYSLNRQSNNLSMVWRNDESSNFSQLFTFYCVTLSLCPCRTLSSMKIWYLKIDKIMECHHLNLFIWVYPQRNCFGKLAIFFFSFAAAYALVLCTLQSKG